MTMNGGRRERGTAALAAALVIFLVTISTSQCSSSSARNHRVDDDLKVNVSATLRAESRLDDDDDDDVADLSAQETRRANVTLPDKAARRNRKPLFPATAEDRGRRTVEPSRRDSYLDALEHSRTSRDPDEGVVLADVKPKKLKIARREYAAGPVYRPEKDKGSDYATGTPSRQSYGAANPTAVSFLPAPGDSYDLPVQPWGTFNPEPTYGSSQLQNSYGTPSQLPAGINSGPAATRQQFYAQHSNGGYPPPAAPQQGYGPPAPAYGAPYALSGLPQLPSFDFGWPFALKLNAFTLAKIILKLVIFKMIVKFIAVICLLLFIPKLEIIKKGEMDEDEGRGLSGMDSVLDRLGTLTSVVAGSIEKHENRDGKNRADAGAECSSLPLSFGCRLKETLAYGESWSNYSRLLESYALSEEQQRLDEDGELHDRPREERSTIFVAS